MVYLGADHRGFELKEKIRAWLKDWGVIYEDCGAFGYVKTDDYPDYAEEVAQRLIKAAASKHGNKMNMGIVICGSGVGVSIVVNRFNGVFCGLGFNRKQVRHARVSENINVLALPSNYLTEKQAKGIVKVFLETKFSGEERHVRRLEKIARYVTRNT